MKTKVITGFHYNMVRLAMLINIWWVGTKLYKNPITSFKTVRQLIQNFTKMMGEKKLVRAFKVDRLYYWDMFNPGWPSKGFDAFFHSHLLELNPITGDEQIIRRLIVAITKRCPLSCEHCSEADTLYQKDMLSVEEFIQKIDPFIAKGVGQLILSGGEPLSRFDDLLTLLNHYKGKCDQWVYTSAFGLTEEKALLLKQAGLNGAAISLDRHEKTEHNSFRGNKHSYDHVIDAIGYLKEVGILVSINVCPSRAYIEEGSVEKMIALAKKLTVPIVNILEPRSVGNYQNKNIELLPQHKIALKTLSDAYNFDRKNVDYPTVLYPGGYRKVQKCGGGRSYLFMDFDGALYPCPFCKTKMPSVVKDQDLCIAS
jgi:MoaA/NifB/PqqE/SkfB family radical SAM enzyme